ncbi:hypothetical protein AQJ43_09475 [Streptomyces avermitilis]|nr:MULTISPECIES: hypothetical protein [Streptomyces]KUN55162.1 hypothetical protein AQJ43_09475 [Streptomyces avermitilis]MYS97043.1 hypothetical protein [Streptomyces sp. SID5469]OOV26730.1 hypothetical protein SM007_23115 [Streptomyces avermitilis]BBJ49073.1 hypothetical protein SAVMC3_17020 [Streptomyces avermitilis]GDY61116.1 hypothetical protein SAV14893_005090 [Streptomyces avermitilis]
MPANSARTVHLLVALALLAGAAVAGCGGEKEDGSRGAEVGDGNSASPQVKVRAGQVADAWDGSKAAEIWHKGYYPMGEVVQLPGTGLHNDADKRAYKTGNFLLRGGLPASFHKDGQVRWGSGGSLTLPLMGAQKAYMALDRDSSDGPHLVATGAKLGEMTLTTSRGPATVPAWLFTLEGYDTPLKRVAVSPSKLPEPPIKPAKGMSTNVLAPLGGLVQVAGDGRSVTVVATHGSCDDGPAVDVLETGGSVVLSASVVGAKDGACTSELGGEKVTVKLGRPVGNRILLDASTGRPVPYSKWPETSPSWS